MDIKGVAAIVTGGASGLGGATAERLARAGAKVTIFDLNEEVGQAHAKAIDASFLKVDVTDEAQVEAALDQAQAQNGVARILVNCAGVVGSGKVLARDGSAIPVSANFAKTITINLIGTYNVLSKFAARLQAAEPVGEERGLIVNTASIAAFEGQVGQPAYSASKGGIVAMTLPLARELARFGIRVMAIAPGIFMTPMMAGLPEDVQASLGQQVPFPSRLGRPEEYAQLVETIAANPMLNGEVIRLDGAMRMGAK
jgi:NAD(P)-dependent dehydrogenase (short-subunit alcohol dehydrogenase family)